MRQIQRFSKAIEALAIVCGVAGLGCLLWGISELGGSIFKLVVSGQYPFEPFWQTLGLGRSPHKFLEWDRVWWLLVIMPLILFGLANEIGEAATEAAKNARQLAKDRMERRDSDLDMAKADQQRRQRKRAKRESSPMNGWQRLGVVLSVLFGLPTFLAVYADQDSAWGAVYPTEQVKSLEGQAFWNALYRQAEQADPDRYRGCIRSTIRMEAPASGFDSSYSITCEKTALYAGSRAILWALLPAVVIWTIGLTIAWVVAGFKRRPR